MNKKVIYTCITGNYDDLKNHTFVNSGWDYVCFTDNLNIRSDENSKWEIRPLVFSTLDEVRNQRWHKLHPHILFPEYEESLWVDGNINIINNGVFDDIELVKSRGKAISIPKHPERNCLYDELKACILYHKDNEELMKKQINLIRKEKFPENFGLFETNIIYRKHDGLNLVKIMEDWWHWVKNYSRRDQLSLNYVLWKNNFFVKPLNDKPYRNFGLERISFFENKNHITKEELIGLNKKLKTEIFNLQTEKTEMETEIKKNKEERDKIIRENNKEAEEREKEFLSLKNEIVTKDAQIRAFLNSTSWKITKPVRCFKNKIFRSFVLLKKSLKVFKEFGFLFLVKKIILFVRNRYFPYFYWVYSFFSGNKKHHSELITVVIPIYDRTWELKESIESILNQTYQNFELILVTDGSPAETVKVVEGYRNNPKVKIFHYYNNTGNAVRGRNKAIKESKGSYIAFQDSDDVAEKDRLEKSLSYIKKNEADVVYGGWRVILDGTRNDTGLKNKQEVFSPDCDYKTLKKNCIPCQGTVMVKKKALLDVGGLKPCMKYREDHELWARLSYFGFKFKSIPSILTNLRIHSGNNELVFKKDDNHWYDLMVSQHVLKEKIPIKIAYVIPGVGISGGISVVLYHLNGLLEKGYDVFAITLDGKDKIEWFPDQKVPIIPLSDIYDKNRNYVFENIDVLVATHWSTFEKVLKLKSKKKMYFIQSDERNFEEGERYKKDVEKTYSYEGKEDVEFFTMARWIRDWIKKEFGKKCSYVKNGLDLNIFKEVEPIEKRNGKRVLIEGPISLPFKGVKNAFSVTNNLDCEVWAVSSDGIPKPEWRCDKFYEKVNLFEMPKIYSSCDILLKMSEVESFAYPPLEMMACGGVPVIKSVPGIEEYAKDGFNCIIVKNQKEAVGAIKKLLNDKDFYEILRKNAIETAKNFSWSSTIDTVENIINNKIPLE